MNNPIRLEEERKQSETLKLKLGATSIYTNKTQTLSSSKSAAIIKNNYEGNGSSYYNLTAN